MSQRIATFCSDLIASSGPLPLPELAARVRTAGLTKSRNPGTTVRSALSRSGGFMLLPDQRYDAARRMLDGAVLTHRIRSGYASRQSLYAGLELAPFALLLTDQPLPLATGGEVRRSIGDIDGWFGPSGWLPAVPADTLIALRLTDGTLTIEPVTCDPDVLEARAERVRTVASRHLAGVEDRTTSDRPRAVVTVILRALAECPDLLAEPVPPLDETLRVPRPAWRQQRYYDGFGSYDAIPPPYSPDLNPFDLLSADYDDDYRGEPYGEPDDDLCERLYAESQAAAALTGENRPAGPAGSSVPRIDRRPR